jgi:uncharacterized protein DUF1236
MRKTLLATVAVAAVVGFGGIAAAQPQTGGESNKSGATSGSTQEKSGGSMSGTQSGGSKTLSPSSNPSSSQSSNPSKNESAQGMQKRGTENERQGQTEQKGMTRGAQDEKGATEQKGAQQERGLQKNKKGAQEERQERGKNLKGAEEQRGTGTKGVQEERGTNLKGAQEQRGTDVKGAEQQRGTMGGSATVGERGERSRSVQLSEDQRSQVKTIVARGNAPRFTGNVDFDVRVGTRIPRSVHFVALPEDVVRIVPEYRGFDYVLIRDEILIIDPDTLEIVAIIPA